MERFDDEVIEAVEEQEEPNDRRGNRQAFRVLRNLKALEQKLNEYLTKGQNELQTNRD